MDLLLTESLRDRRVSLAPSSGFVTETDGLLLPSALRSQADWWYEDFIGKGGFVSAFSAVKKGCRAVQSLNGKRRKHAVSVESGVCR